MNLPRFVALDSWRGISACFVALLHFPANSHLRELNLLGNAYLFVDFFFVLSGFVIAANYEERIRKGFGAAKFMLLRFGRLYPLHLAMLAVYVGSEGLHYYSDSLAVAGHNNAFTGGRVPETIFYDLLLIQNIGFVHSSWNSPSWSISIEFYAYAVFAVSLITFKSRFWIFCSLAVVVGALALFADEQLGTVRFQNIFRCLFGFFAGVLVWKAYHRFGERVSRALANRGVAAATEATVLLVAFTYLSIAPNTIKIGFAAPVFMLLVFVFAFEAGPISRLLQFKPMVGLGTLSYSIYMVHMFIVDSAKYFAKKLDASLDWTLLNDVGGNLLFGAMQWQGDLYHGLFLACVVFFSVVTYSLIERPARSWSRKLAYARRDDGVGRPITVSDKGKN